MSGIRALHGEHTVYGSQVLRMRRCDFGHLSLRVSVPQPAIALSRGLIVVALYSPFRPFLRFDIRLSCSEHQIQCCSCTLHCLCLLLSPAVGGCKPIPCSPLCRKSAISTDTADRWLIALAGHTKSARASTIVPEAEIDGHLRSCAKHTSHSQ